MKPRDSDDTFEPVEDSANGPQYYHSPYFTIARRTLMELVALFVQEVLKPVVPAGTQRFYRGVPKHFRVTLPSLRRSDVALSCRVDHVFLRVCRLTGHQQIQLAGGASVFRTAKCRCAVSVPPYGSRTIGAVFDRRGRRRHSSQTHWPNCGSKLHLQNHSAKYSNLLQILSDFLSDPLPN